MGVRLSNLRHQAEQLPLFEDERKRLFATQAMDRLNAKYGSRAVTFGSLIQEKEESESRVIPPSWRPDGIRNIDVE
jgi:DNA polymerase-4